ALPERDDHVLDARIPHVLGVRVPLAAVADDGDLLALDQIDVGITIVIDAHGSVPRTLWLARLRNYLVTPSGSTPRLPSGKAQTARRSGQRPDPTRPRG